MSRRSSSATSRPAERRRSERGGSLVALIASMTIMLIGMGIAAPAWKHVDQRDREEQLVFSAWEIVKGIRAYQARHGTQFPVSLKQMVDARNQILRKEYDDPITRRGSTPGKWSFVRPEDQSPECQKQAQLPPGVPQGDPGGGIPGLTTPTPPRPGGGGGPSGGGGNRTPPPFGATPPGMPGMPGGPQGTRTPGPPGFNPRQRQGDNRLLGAAPFAIFIGPELLLGQSFPPLGGAGNEAAPGEIPGASEVMGPFKGVRSRSDRESIGVFNGKNKYKEWCFTIDTIDPSIISFFQLKMQLMRVPEGKTPKFTGKGKADPHSGREPPVNEGGGASAPSSSEGTSEYETAPTE